MFRFARAKIILFRRPVGGNDRTRLSEGLFCNLCILPRIRGGGGGNFADREQIAGIFITRHEIFLGVFHFSSQFL